MRSEAEFFGQCRLVCVHYCGNFPSFIILKFHDVSMIREPTVTFQGFPGVAGTLGQGMIDSCNSGRFTSS